MKKEVSNDEMVVVPAQVLRGLILSFAQGMHYFAGTSNLMEKLNEVLKGKTPGQQSQERQGPNL